MFICPNCEMECYVNEDGFIIECSGCEDGVGEIAIYVDDNIDGF